VVELFSVSRDVPALRQGVTAVGSDGRRNRRRQGDDVLRDDTKRDEILTAAMEVFARYGFRKTTVGDIIREAGVSRATVYKHFTDKGGIFDAVVRREMLEVLAADRRAVEGESTTRGRLRAAITTHAELIRRKINLLRLTKERFAEIVPHSADRVRELTTEATALFASILRRGVEDGDIHVKDVDRAALTVLYACKGIFMTAVMDSWEDDRDIIVENMLDMLMDGLRPRKEVGS
jgi:AcrR family transcriptional regulator